MVQYEIEGGAPLYGSVHIQGSKNAALPMMAASVLQKGCVCLEGCPDIADVRCMEEILRAMGAKVWRKGADVYLDCKEIQTGEIQPEHANRMRSSVMLLGPVLGRVGEIAVGRPGGCVIGRRPIDLHLQVLQKMGARLEEQGGRLTGRCSGLKGCTHRFPKVSVGATENAVMAAAAAEGETLLENCAREPEIVHLCRFLRAMGAQIEGEQTGRIWVGGKRRLSETRFPIPADRIVAGTYLFAGAATRGIVCLEGAPEEEMGAVLAVYRKMGGQYEAKGGKLIADSRRVGRPAGEVATGSYPGFPTDLQSPLLAVCAMADGKSTVEETIFEDRYRAACEMQKLGAQICIDGRRARIEGTRLKGACVYARDLRGGAALVVAGLGARGRTLVRDICYVERGYEDICADIRALGGRIDRRCYEE